MSDRPSDNLGGMDIGLARQIDEVCRRFEAAWREGCQPRIDDYLGGVVDEGLIITTYTPPLGDEGDYDQPAAFVDWVELYNNDSSPVNLTGSGQQNVDYRISYELSPTTPNDDQGGTARVRLVWEVRVTAS